MPVRFGIVVRPAHVADQAVRAEVPARGDELGGWRIVLLDRAPSKTETLRVSHRRGQCRCEHGDTGQRDEGRRARGHAARVRRGLVITLGLITPEPSRSNSHATPASIIATFGVMA